MGSIDDIMQLCRLCLVKDQVNIPIFEETSDIGQTFVKINQCLPVKVSRDDNLPKKICDGCSYKLDMLYVFRNTSVESEKQLVSWLSQLGSSLSQTIVKDGVTKPEIMVKQETFESTEARLEGDDPKLSVEELGVDAHTYIMQQQKLPYQQDFAAFGEPSGSSEEPPPKKAKRAVTVKKQNVPVETEEDALETAMQITKAEQEEDSDDVDQPDYVEAPSTSADDQPGPSGVGKGTIEAPFSEFTCNICFRTYPTKDSFKQHKKRHREKKYLCKQCPKSFITNVELSSHVRGIHEKARTHFCNICSYATFKKSALDKHIVARHTKLYPFKCEICKHGYFYKHELDNHRLVKHEGLRFICQYCDKVFKNQQYLNNHMKTHDPEFMKQTYVCQLCSKVLKTKRTFNEHMKKHNGELNAYVCDVCEKSVTSMTSLRDHKNRHTGEKNYICEECGKTFFTRYTLQVHKRVHTKERPYSCNICEKTFTQRPPLTIHMRYHTGERPYKCHLCSKGFVSKTLLKSHKC